MGRKNSNGKNFRKIKACEICGGFTQRGNKRCVVCINMLKIAFKGSKLHYDKEEE